MSDLAIRIALERLVYLNTIRAHVLDAFGPARTHRARLKHSDVTKHVATCLRKEFSPALARDVRQAMRAHGWNYVTHARTYLWKGMHRR